MYLSILSKVHETRLGHPSVLKSYESDGSPERDIFPCHILIQKTKVIRSIQGGLVVRVYQF